MSVDLSNVQNRNQKHQNIGYNIFDLNMQNQYQPINKKQQEFEQPSGDGFAKYLYVIIPIRFLFCFFVMFSYAHPDEYWQSMEIAHKISFGYGFETWQWTIPTPIRSHFFPYLISRFYQLFKLLGLTNPNVIIYAPRLYQTVVAVIFDYFLLKLNHIYNPGTDKILMALNYTSAFSLEFISRVYVNSTEATFCIVAFYLWCIRHKNSTYDMISRSLVVIGFMARSSLVLFWAVVWPYELWTMRGDLWSSFKFILKNATTIICMLGGSLLFNFLWTGKLELIQYNFVKINIIDDVSSKFGQTSFFFNFVLIPFLLSFGHTYLLLRGLREIIQSKHTKRLKQLLVMTLLILLLISTSKHKEDRFLLVLIPALFIFIVKGYSNLNPKYIRWLFLVIIIDSSIRILIGLGRFNALKPVNYLRNDNTTKAILFMVRPHFTPFYCLVHKNIPMRMPQIFPNDPSKDQQSLFWDTPYEAQKRYLQELGQTPSHMIVEQELLKTRNFTVGPKWKRIKHWQIGNHYGTNTVYLYINSQ